MRETKINWGQECPRHIHGESPAEAQEQRPAPPGEPIRWVTVTEESPTRLRGALRRDEQGPYLRCGCGQIIRPGDDLLAAGDSFYCPDCAGLWLAANLSRFGGLPL